MATIEHLYSRETPGRGHVPWKTHVAACYKCNISRDVTWPLDRKQKKD